MKHLLTAFIALYAIFSVQAGSKVIAESHENLDCDSAIVVIDTAEFDPFPDVTDNKQTERYTKILRGAQLLLDSDPLSSPGRYFRGYANIRLGYPEKAVGDMAFAWLTGFENPHLKSPEFHMRYLAENVPETVISVLTPVESRHIGLMDDPPVPMYKIELILARAYEKMGKRGVAARIHYPRALAAIPSGRNLDDFLQALYNQTVDWIYSGHPDIALQVLDRPEWKYDRDPAHFTLRSLALRNLGRLDEAISLMDSVISVCPPDHRLFDHYATLLSHAGRLDKAIVYFSKALNIIEADTDLYPASDHYKVLLHRGNARELIGDSNGARADYLDVIKRQPDNLIALSLLDRRDTVLRLLDKKNHSYKYSFYDLSIAYSNLGDDSKALHYLGKALESQIITPQSVLYDPNLKRLTSLPGYPATAARFNPDN